MNISTKMITTLQNKPIIGIIGGFSSAAFGTIREFLISASVLNYVTICGMWIGLFIGLITLVIKLAELSRLLNNWVRGKKK